MARDTDGLRAPTLAEVNTPEVRKAVRAYLLAKSTAEVLRAKVDAIYREVLQEVELFNDLDVKHGVAPRRRVTERNDVYLSFDTEALARVYKLTSDRERAAGIKPAEMQDDYCPALVAENRLLDLGNAMIEASGRAFGLAVDGRAGRMYGAHRKRWLELVVQLITQQPEYAAEGREE